MMSFALPPSVRDVGLRSSPLNVSTAALTTRRFDPASTNDEKKQLPLLALDALDDKTGGEDGDEMGQSYIPLSLARAKMAVLSDELAAMKSKHLALIDQITSKYEKLTNESRAHFEGVVDEVKARATLRLKENKALVEELREQLVEVQEAQAAKNQTYRSEVKTATQEQGRLQQELLQRDEELKQMRETHEADVAAIAARQLEVDTLLASRVPKEDLESLQEEKTTLAAMIESSAREYQEKIANLQADIDDKTTRLADLDAQLAALQESHAAATAKVTETEEQLTQARTDLDEVRAKHDAANATVAEHVASLATLKASLDEASSGADAHRARTEQLERDAEEAVAASRRTEQELQDRLTEQETKVTELEAQLLVAQTSGGDGSGDGPARIITVPDPELQTKVRALESEMNKILRENVDLCKLLTEREGAVKQANEVLASVQAAAQSAIVVSAGSNTAVVDAEPGEDDSGAKSEYEEVETEEEVEEMVAEVVPSSSSSAASDEHASKRIELATLLAANESETARLIGLVTGVEREIKPKVVDYKTRLAEFKTDAERKELETNLGYDKLTEEDGTEHELRPADIRELEDMLEWTDTQGVVKPDLAQRVAVLKENKKQLETNKTKLADLKNTVTEMKAASAPAEEVATKEAEFLALRTQMQADATELKSSYASYELSVKDFKEKEASLQKLYAKFKVDPEHEAEKPRKLSTEQRTQVERLVALIKNKGKERDALKALAEEVNTQNARLKELRTERDQAQTKATEAKTELEALPPPPVATGEVGEETRMVPRRVKRRTTKRVKKPQTSRSKRRTPGGSGAGGAPLIPADFLANLKPIELRGPSADQYAGREFKPVTPATFKAGPTVADLAAAGASSGGGGGGRADPALQAKYDEASKRASKLESEVAALKLSSEGKDETLAAKEAELEALRTQLRLMSEGEVDERIAALAQQLEAQRSEVASTGERHQARLAEIQAQASHAKEEAASAADEVAKMKGEVKNMQERVRQANARAAAGGGGGGVAAGAVAGGVAGGVDPSIVADLESQRDELQSTIDDLNARIVALEAELAAKSGSVGEQLARREAELQEAHAAKVTELETQLTEGIEKLRITKKKAKELHDALKAETTKREGLEATVAERDATIASMEAITNEARNSMDALKAEIASRDEVITTKSAEITALEEKKAALEADVAFLEVRNAEEVKRRKEFQFKYEDAKGKVRVYARVRPFSKHEIAANEKTLLRPGTNEWTLCINETQKNYQGIVSDNWRPIEFDHVFQFGLENTKGNASQIEIFEETKIFAELTVQGINCCVFAYGQSGTGKTFTMAGVKPNEGNGFTRDLLGLKPRMIDRVYEMKNELRKTHTIEVSCYMLEIYLNKLEDVFWKLQTQQKYQGQKKEKWPEPPELKVRVDAKRKVTVDGSIILSFDSSEEMQKFCDSAEQTRRVRKTGLNEESSRSHLIFAIIATATDKKTGKKTTGKLSLVDLAGSERAEKTNVEGLSKAARAAMMEEGIAINESLRMLKSVFRILGEANKPLAKGQKAEIVQYRGNTLTELMQDSLGGNAKTLMFVNVGPAASNINESVDSLAYGDLVKNITNEKVAEDADNEEQIRFLGAKLRAYEAKFGPID